MWDILLMIMSLFLLSYFVGPNRTHCNFLSHSRHWNIIKLRNPDCWISGERPFLALHFLKRLFPFLSSSLSNFDWLEFCKFERRITEGRYYYFLCQVVTWSKWVSWLQINVFCMDYASLWASNYWCSTQITFDSELLYQNNICKAPGTGARIMCLSRRENEHVALLKYFKIEMIYLLDLISRIWITRKG